jgi:hypothetical protein
MAGRNDGGIKRGDRADTGDLEARHKDGVSQLGSGVPGGDGGATGHVTGSTDALAESRSGVELLSDEVPQDDGGIDDLYASDADDPTLGMTDIEDRPAEDWAANTGPSKSGRAEHEEIEELPQEFANPKRPKK